MLKNRQQWYLLNYLLQLQTILRKLSYVVFPRNVKFLNFVFNYLNKNIFQEKIKNTAIVKVPLGYPFLPNGNYCSLVYTLQLPFCYAFIYIYIYLQEIHSFVSFKFLHKLFLLFTCFATCFFLLPTCLGALNVNITVFHFIFSHISLGMFCLF